MNIDTTLDELKMTHKLLSKAIDLVDNNPDSHFELSSQFDQHDIKKVMHFNSRLEAVIFQCEKIF